MTEEHQQRSPLTTRGKRPLSRVRVCNSLVTVVVEAVVAAQCSQGAQADGVGEEDLGAGIDPHLDTDRQLGSGPETRRIQRDRSGPSCGFSIHGCKWV